MKLIIRRKGGSGSGHFDHAGIPGHQGGSLPGKGSNRDQEVFDAMQALYDNPIMRRIATAYAADGAIDDVANITEEVAETLDIYVTTEGDETFPIEDKFFDSYQESTLMEGYLVEDENNISAEREAWEKYYYGRVVGGYSNGQKFASNAIKDFVKNGTVPEGNFSKKKPKKAAPYVRKPHAVDSFSKDEQFWLFNEPEGAYWSLGSNATTQDIERLLKKMPGRKT